MRNEQKAKLIPILFTANEQGEVFNKHNNKHLKGSNNNGYLALSITYNKKRYSYLIHQIVASLLIDNPNKYTAVNHLNGNKTDNKVSNLEWCSLAQNTQHAYKNGLMAGLALTEEKVHQIWNLRLGNPFMTSVKIAEIVGSTKSNVNDILAKKSWKDIAKIYPDYKLYFKLLPEELNLIRTQNYKESMKQFGISSKTVNRIKQNPIKYCLEPYKADYINTLS